MNILVITAKDSFKAKTGSANIAKNHILWLKKEHSVDVVNISDYKKTNNIIKKNIFYLINLLIGIPVSVSSMYRKNAKKDIKKLIDSKKIDLIIAFEISTIQYCPKNLYHKLIANIEDPQSIRLKKILKLTTIKPYKKLKYFINYKTTILYEKKVFPKIKKILLLSKSDVNEMKNEGHYNVGYVTYGIHSPNDSDILSYENREKRIIISGNMNHDPNIDGVLFFINKIFPFISEKNILKLIIVGSNPDKRICETAKKYKKNIIITGKVDNISNYIEKSLISVCPVLLKIGVQTKVLEALALGTPVVTTSAGNSGVKGKNEIDLFIEDNPEKIAQNIIKLTNKNIWNTFSKNGKHLVENSFSWNKSFSELNNHINEILK